MMAETVDQKYYQAIKPSGIAEKLLIAARDRIYRDFVKHMQPTPGSSIVDVGVSDVVTDGANVLERKYPYPRNITACGIGVADEFRTEFPDVRYIRIEPNTLLPFESAAFEIATANAVLEHVGSVANQRSFLGELLRIANRVFVTVPNRYFPVEHHTAIPLLHFNDRSFAITCSMLRKSTWADTASLILMTQKKLSLLAADFDRYAEIAIGTTGLNLGPFSSNLFLSLRRRA